MGSLTQGLTTHPAILLLSIGGGGKNGIFISTMAKPLRGNSGGVDPEGLVSYVIRSSPPIWSGGDVELLIAEEKWLCNPLISTWLHCEGNNNTTIDTVRIYLRQGRQITVLRAIL